jgi:hypothetical protein
MAGHSRPEDGVASARLYPGHDELRAKGLFYWLRAGAGEGNRTLVCSLGSCRSTIELRPRSNEINHLGKLTVNFVCHFFADVVDRSCLSARRYLRMQFLYWIEMPPSNRLGINDNEENERSPGAFNITREAQRRMVR